MTMNYTTVIGLEVHLQLGTASKIFCGCATRFASPPNSQVCPVCLGFPGALPVLNRKALQYGIRVALGLGCAIEPHIVFHRKNYFYPDLPKDFQISQYDLPLGKNGTVELPERKIRVQRVHLEEDAGKLLHKEQEAASLVDYNRAGMPLLEIVSQPDLTSPEEAHTYLQTLKGILMYLEVSDCDMEKGSLRCDANVSLSQTPGELGTKVEIKNLNSFKAVAQALAYEIKRQTKLLEEGGRVMQETRLWDDARAVTRGMRSKEFAHDYRYFPEPDLVPFEVSAQEIEAVKKSLPELSHQRARRFQKQYELPSADSKILTAAKATADYFEACIKMVPGAVVTKMISNWILGELARQMNERNINDIAALNFPPGNLVELVNLVNSGRVSHKMAKEIFMECLESHESPAAVVEKKNLVQVTDRGALKEAALEVVGNHPKAVEDYRKGKEQSLMFLVGQLMKKTKGTASPAVSKEILQDLLKEGHP